MNPFTGEIHLGGNTDNSNCSGCLSAAGGDPRSYNDTVGRVMADAFYARGLLRRP